MRNLSIMLLAVLVLLTSHSLVHAEDRYEYIYEDGNNGGYYIDKFSITCTNIPNVFRGWYKNVVYDFNRHTNQLYATSTNDGRLCQISYFMVCFEINLTKNTYKLIESHTYDLNGRVINKNIITPSFQQEIYSNSVMGGMRDAIKRITQNDIVTNPNSNSIIFIALIVGITISALVVYLYAKLTSPTHVDTTTTEGVRKEYEDTSFNSNETKYDFEYPYEDIGKVTGM